MKRTITFFAVSSLVLLALGTANAGMITFDSIGHGVEASTQIPGLTISAENDSFVEGEPGHPNLALGFDSEMTGTADPDLQRAIPGGRNSWSGGNLSDAELESLILGTVIIIAENDVDGNNDGIIDSPDDEGNRPAGTISFLFDDPIASVGFDLVDVEGIGPSDEPGQFAVFYMGSGVLGTVAFADFLDGGLYDQDAEFGNNTVNRISPIGGFGLFDRVDIRMGGSGAVDNLVFGVPAPGAVGLLALGLGLVGLTRRRVQ